DLEEAQDALIEAQNAVTTALVNHLEVRLDYLVELGILETDAPSFWLASQVLPSPKDMPASNAARNSILRGDGVVPPIELFP
ncbi:MAG: hypothetical protein AAGJ31_09695, partial [Verrucomicrobiota bacterium]